ncbi:MULTISPECIES: EAL domain-containing protein [unclassified Arthrobacter]|uniref:sensor domain-containing protein n=1 Tax=unclassified Arthrobacter TaxID=235627 RepID=UPI001C863431|nr:EAL domain-containing protein [Arthrobacter sp. MAHUQ-56]MBX7443354.1 EAL domain-containing protein [Arthrobacter sp. MAHUQ-56]
MAGEHNEDLLTRSLLDEIGQSVVGLDSGWRIVLWNRASERVYGFTAAEALGQRPFDLGIIGGAPPAGQGSPGREILDGLSRGQDWAGELWMRHRGGREFPVHATVSPVRGRYDVPVAVVAISKDITDRKHSEAVLRRLAAMVESSGDAIISADLTRTITSWNAGAARMFGWTAAEAIGQSYRLLTTTDAADLSARVAARVGAGGFATGIDVQWRRKDGSLIDVELTVSPVYGADGARVGASAIARDVTEIRRVKAEAAAERRRLLAAQEIARVGSVEHTPQTGETWHSDEFARILGVDPGQSPDREWMLERTHPEDRELVRRAWANLDNGAGSADVEYRIVGPDGELRWLHSRIRCLNDGEGRPLRFLDTVLDITERKNTEQILQWQARHDALTGLPNRYLITQTLQAFLDRGARPVVMFVDIDRFKLINDGVGHAGGDRVLKLLGERLVRAVRAGDTVGRFGGDEFIIVCENMRMRAAKRLAQRIMDCTRAPFTVDGRQIFLNVSVGISLAGADETAESMLGGADAAMYRAKSGGGDASVIYDPHMRRRASGRLRLESDLRLALGRSELSLHYQPIIDLTTGGVAGFEALLRWNHPEHGMIKPAAFIPIAEETGLIVPIGTWVLQEALRQVQQWRSRIPGAGHLTVAVNISGRQLVADDFPDVVKAAISAAGIDPGAVDLEITETILMEEPDLPRDTLPRLNEFGVGLSLDDFGTGYSSLGYLKWLTARVVKIDRTFIQELGRQPHAATVIELVLGMAQSLKFDVIAEGVETSAQAAELHRLGVGLAQGYYWSKPLPADEVPAWLQDHVTVRAAELEPAGSSDPAP